MKNRLLKFLWLDDDSIKRKGRRYGYFTAIGGVVILLIGIASLLIAYYALKANKEHNREFYEYMSTVAIYTDDNGELKYPRVEHHFEYLNTIEGFMFSLWFCVLIFVFWTSVFLVHEGYLYIKIHSLMNHNRDRQGDMEEEGANL